MNNTNIIYKNIHHDKYSSTWGDSDADPRKLPIMAHMHFKLITNNFYEKST